MNRQKSKNPLSNYAKYSHLAYQMLAVFLLAVFGGYKIDSLLKWNFPLFTLLFSLIAIAIVIFLSVKDFKK